MPRHKDLAPVGADERLVGRALAARAAALVLGVVVSWPIVAGLAAALEHALLDVRRAVVPTFAVRATLIAGEALIDLVVLVLVVRLASGEPPPGSRRMTTARWLALVAFAAASAVGAAASVWYPHKSACAVELLGVVRLAEWSFDSIALAGASLALKTLIAAAGLVYGVVRWQSAERRLG